MRRPEPARPLTSGRSVACAVLLLFVPLFVPLVAQAQEDTAPIDLSALLECRASYEAFMALVPVQADPLRAVALGWQPLPQANPFMVEYRLNAPVQAFGHATDHIAFAGDGVVAVLDLPEPRVLARALALETAVDTPAKALFGREVRAEETAPDTDGTVWIESAVVTVSNVDSHPGRTLAGCSYSLDPWEPDAEEAASATQADASTEASADASPAAAVPR